MKNKTYIGVTWSSRNLWRYFFSSWMTRATGFQSVDTIFNEFVFLNGLNLVMPVALRKLNTDRWNDVDNIASIALMVPLVAKRLIDGLRRLAQKVRLRPSTFSNLSVQKYSCPNEDRSRTGCALKCRIKPCFRHHIFKDSAEKKTIAGASVNSFTCLSSKV